MPTVELLKPKTLNTLGRIWHKGVEEPVDTHTAVILSRSDRFKVRGLDPAMAEAAAIELAAAEPEKPKSKAALGKAIREIVDDVDTDTESNFQANGAPSGAAVTALLGYEVSDEEVVIALNPNAAKPAAVKKEVVAEKPKGGVKITRTPKPPAPLDTGTPADDKPATPADETNAVEV